MRLRRLALTLSAAALLASCGGSQSPIGAPGAVPPSKAIAGRASTAYRVLARFDDHHIGGFDPWAQLIDVNGTLYGTTSEGGLYKGGTVYTISRRGVKKTLYDFRGGPDGANPRAGLVDVNGTLYGTARFGGSGCSQSGGGCGTVFAITTTGEERVIYEFKGGRDGQDPTGGLIELHGMLYGATVEGGNSAGQGTVYSVSTNGTETVMHRFAGTPSDGASPGTGDLIAVHGTLYGTTEQGGSSGYGVVYTITTRGKEKVLHNFSGASDGGHPVAGLIDVDGTMYGTTTYFGSSGCRPASTDACGTVYAMTTNGQEHTVYSFDNAGGGGWYPVGGLTELNGTLYGTTAYGGTSECGKSGYGCGTIYSLSLSGQEQVLHSFSGHRTDGAEPVATLLNVNGTLYGTTQKAPGTVFALTR